MIRSVPDLPCEDCVVEKTTRLTHTRCETCGHWRPMTAAELAKVEKRRG